MTRTVAPRFLLRSASVLFHSTTGSNAAFFHISVVNTRRRCLHASLSRLGVADSLRDAYDTARGRADEKREKLMFEKQMELLCDRSRVFDGNRFLDLLAGMKDASGMGGLKEHLPWVANNPALGEIKDQQAIVCAMSPDERQRLAHLGISAKKRISRTTGLSLDAIDAVTTQIVTLQGIQKWLLKRQDADEALPASSAELQVMVSAPGSGMSRKSPRRAAGWQRPGVKGRR